MAEFIEKTDTLNEGREKINAAIQDAEDAKTIAGQAVKTSNEAKQIAQAAEDKADSTQTQLDTIVIDGDSSVEAAQARVDVKNHVYDTLKQRLDTEYMEVMSRLAQNEQKINTKMSISEGATKQELRQKELEIKSYLDTQLSTIGSMTPKGAFATLQELKNEYPNGTEGIFIVQSDGHWYYWNGDDWTDGGLYQAMPWDEFMTEPDEEWVI